MLNISIHHWAIWCWYRIVWPGAIHIEPCYTNLHVQCVYYYYLSIVQRKIHAPTDQYKINRQHEHDVLWNVHNVSILWYEKNEKVEKKLQFTAIKLLLTEPRPFSALLKCSITSQLDFFGVVVAFPVVSALITGECNDGTWSSSEICGGVRVCRNDVERRPIPFREFESVCIFFAFKIRS